MATVVEQVVAIRVGIQMASGALEPAAARTAMVPVGGNSVMAEVLIARNRIIGLLATPGRAFKRSSSAIAFRPKGVAALPSPRMLEAMFITMAPMAGWSAGTSGKSRRRIGRSARAMATRSPPSWAMRMRPRKKIIGPAIPITRFTASLAPSKAAAETACI